eukprot:TRINITY_DN1220_c0_g1_i1.p1 TRINITY_DN1220_c0_g1~~TRINITY_DN1220_c0_g1_i1.p1  ORF type:complete len:234 (-),score=72.75 TRINITY_DN1220_c0_g1_i1:771-1373(-)
MPQRSFAAVGTKAPEFSATALVGKEFKNLTLSSYSGKWVVLFFYPLDFTFVCPSELTGMSDEIDRFKELNAEVVGVSVDSHFTHLAFSQTARKEGGLGGLKFPLLSDLTHGIGEAYSAMNGNSGHHLRATYIIDPKGIVRHVSMNDPPVGRSVDELVRVTTALQFADKHGEVCPLNWTPGKDTIDTNDKLKYFSKHGSEE